MILDEEGGGQKAVDAFGQNQGAARTGKVVQQDREFVSAQARHGILAAQQVFKPLRELDEQVVSCGVSQGIVDVLESVEIEKTAGRSGVRPRAESGAAPA